MLRALAFLNPGVLLALGMYVPVFRWGTTLNEVRHAGEKEALDLARFFRQAIIWGMLALGSALVLVGAVVTLIGNLRGSG